MSEISEAIKFIREKLEERDIRLQMQEETAEATAACCKLVRIMRGRNPSPMTEEEARSNLQEELRDIANVLLVMGMVPAHHMEREDISPKLAAEYMVHYLRSATGETYKRNLKWSLGNVFDLAKKLGLNHAPNPDKIIRWRKRLEEKQ